MRASFGVASHERVTMRQVRLFLVLVAAATISGCTGGPPGTQSPAATGTQATPTSPQSPGITQPPSTQPPSTTPPATLPPATTPPANTPAPGANTMSYEISGEYSASGEAVFQTSGSGYTDEGQYGLQQGWVAYFEDPATGHTIRLATRADSLAIEFFGGDVVVRATGYEGSQDGCTFNITKNDASGPAGSAVCERAVVHPNGATYVNFSVEWSVDL